MTFGTIGRADMAASKFLFKALTRRSSTAALPARVAEIVREKDRESEKLLCYAQFMLAGTLGLLYAIAPRPSDVSSMIISPVPVALAGYAALTALRFAHVTARPLSKSGVAFSIVADMALLFGLIWTFHWVYGQPPPFSLKAPTFVYAFVFIAIRSLRFDFRYVLAAGLAAAAGWAAVTVSAIWLSPEGTITRSFSDYLLSNRILIGAEFDKIFAILAVTAVLSISAFRAERTLVAAVREETAKREIGRFLSRGVADQIASADTRIQAGTATERQAAIMFLDIRGFTHFSMTVPPAEVVAMLTSFHARIVPVVRAHRGVIDKFLGDGVMITFGAVEASGRAAADALRALDALLTEAARWREELSLSGRMPPLAVNAAVASGRVVFAAVGDENRLEYTVIGEAVNLAAKLEKHNKAEHSLALTTLATLNTAKAQGYTPAGMTGVTFCSHRCRSRRSTRSGRLAVAAKGR